MSRTVSRTAHGLEDESDIFNEACIEIQKFFR